MSIITYVKLFFMIWVKIKTGHPLCLPWPQMKRIRRRARHSPPLPFLKQLIPGHMSSECRFRDFRPRVAFILTSTIISPLPRCQSQVQQGCSGSFHPFRLKNEFTGFHQSASSAAILVYHVLKISKASPPPVLPPRQSGRHWNTQGTIWAADEVYRPLSSVPARRTLFNGLRSSCTDAAIIIFPIKKLWIRVNEKISWRKFCPSYML